MAKNHEGKLDRKIIMADLTLTIPDAQVIRVRTALASNVGVDPATFTAEDARQAIIEWLKGTVRNYEVTEGLNAINDAAKAQQDAYIVPTDVSVT